MKRSIQDPQPASGEPAAKRIAVSSNQSAEQRDLEAAQVALDRLDHATVHRICTEVSRNVRSKSILFSLSLHPMTIDMLFLITSSDH